MGFPHRLKRDREEKGGKIPPGNEGVPETKTFRERGRRRTRQDQISRKALRPVKLRTMRSAPNEENLFLLPDEIFSERTPRNYDPAV
jgi:hypothetical protein